MTMSDFADQDMDVLRAAVRLVPDLRLAAKLGSLARTRLQFPITSHEQVSSLLEGTLEYRGHSVTPDKLIAIAKGARFPISDIFEFVEAAYVGILRAHHADRGDPEHLPFAAFRERVCADATRGGAR